MMNGGRDPRENQRMRRMVDRQYVVGLCDVPVERCPAAGDDGAPTDGAYGGDGLSYQLRSAWRYHAAEADVDRRSIDLKEGLDSRIQCPWLLEHPRVGAHHARRRVIRQRP